MGPWGESQLLVWCPEVVASEPPVHRGLEAKLGALVLTLICSLVSICVLGHPGANQEGLTCLQKTLRIYSGHGLLLVLMMEADHTGLQGVVGATIPRGSEGFAGNST
ncbi:zinc transporter ZIP1-like [Tamandua tetradactyla]|uniref:zinc transporter ZIP1-like n=1 Tax=Tamandua tetradactyla TaxID=48850 RepID=UPI004053BD93